TPLATVIRPQARHAVSPAMTTITAHATSLEQTSGADLRYVKAGKTWMVWNGKRWEADATDKVTRLAHDTLRAMAAKALGVSDRRQRDELLRHMMASEGHHRIQAMVAEAQALLPARPEDFDRDPWLLNV